MGISRAFGEVQEGFDGYLEFSGAFEEDLREIPSSLRCFPPVSGRGATWGLGAFLGALEDFSRASGDLRSASGVLSWI